MFQSDKVPSMKPCKIVLPSADKFHSKHKFTSKNIDITRKNCSLSLFLILKNMEISLMKQNANKFDFVGG